MTTTSVQAPVTQQSKTRLAAAFGDRPWLVCTLVAGLLLLVASFLPLWHMKLIAPQYPNGVNLTAYGTTMTGDLHEVNTLNHYVGIRPIEPDSVRELQLFPYAVALVLVIALVAAFFARRRWEHIIVSLIFWCFPIGMLIDLQYWLYDYGHDLNPDAPLRFGTFTPKVIGSTKLVNFHSQNMVQIGWWLMLAAALIISFGPVLFRFLRDSWNNTGPAAAAGAAGLLLIGAVTLAPAERAHAQEPAVSIAQLIDRAAPGSTVEVPAGTYHEQVTVTKPLTLVGVGRPVIDGGGKGDVVVIAADGVTLRGFVIQGSNTEVSDEPCAVRLNGNRATIEQNVIRNVLYGIILEDTVGHTIRGNEISSIVSFNAERRGHAVYMYHSQDNTITDNTIHDVKDGVFIGFGDHNHVEGNTVTRARYGIHYMYANDNTFIRNSFTDSVAGGALMFSRGIILRDNVFSGNRSAASGYGILFKDVDDVEMTGNLIHHNRLGMTMEGAPHTPGATVLIKHNLIGFNQSALELSTTTAAVFTENTFTGNLDEVSSRGGDLGTTNSWSADGVGNYWDEYQGYDANNDGRGDIPFRYQSAYNQLAREHEALRAYAYTPARTALDMVARWFPVYQPEPDAVDDHPLMSPSMKLGGESGSRDMVYSLGAGLLLGGIPALLAWYARGSLQRRWQVAC